MIECMHACQFIVLTVMYMAMGVLPQYRSTSVMTKINLEVLTALTGPLL